MRLQHEFMVGIKDSHAYEVLYNGHQIENEALTRIPMEGRLYHIKYDTLNSKEG
jgi:hypothetical protein